MCIESPEGIQKEQTESLRILTKWNYSNDDAAAAADDDDDGGDDSYTC